MQEMDVIKQRLGLNIEPSDEKCEKHGVKMNRLPFGLVCNECTKEKVAEEDRQFARASLVADRRNRTVRVLHNKSLVVDMSLWDAEFSNYAIKCEEQTKNVETAKQVARKMSEGEHVTLWLVGKAGAGKSHLAMAILKVLNRHGENQLNHASENGLDVKNVGTSTLFINFDAMLRKIRDSYKNKESMYTEEYFINLCTEVDVLVIDDLGAETGAIDSTKTATDFVHRMLYAIGTSRQTKPTIITTNLRSAQREALYDEKDLSRLKRNRKEIVFIETPDHRDSEFEY